MGAPGAQTAVRRRAARPVSTLVIPAGKEGEARDEEAHEGEEEADRQRVYCLHRSARGCAIRAGADDLDGMGDVDKTVLVASPRGPPFDLWSFDFDCAAAVAADEVVVVLAGGAATVTSFAIVAS